MGLPVPIRQPVRVWTPVPHPRRCHAAMCDVPAAGHAIWLAHINDQVMLQAAEICAGHVVALREDPTMPCLTFPLDALPHHQTLIHRIREEYQRRQQRVHTYNDIASSTAAYFSTFLQYSNATGNMTFRFTA